MGFMVLLKVPQLAWSVRKTPDHAIYYNLTILLQSKWSSYVPIPSVCIGDIGYWSLTVSYQIALAFSYAINYLREWTKHIAIDQTEKLRRQNC